jgi:hypothetical protein
MKLKVYEQLLAMNQGFDQVRRTLHALASCPDVDRGEIRRFQQLAAEARAATNSFLLEALATRETDHAGRLFVRRRRRERKEERA